MLQRSKPSDCIQSKANASWSSDQEEEEQHQMTLDQIVTRRSSQSGLLLLLGRHVESSDYDAKQRHFCFNTNNNSKKQRLLVDTTKMDRLLQMLRTEDFAGEIDPEHHAQYLSSPDYTNNSFYAARQQHPSYKRSHASSSYDSLHERKRSSAANYLKAAVRNEAHAAAVRL
jgi:hypothetical protein